jgi:hypothetical protein
MNPRLLRLTLHHLRKMNSESAMQRPPGESPSFFECIGFGNSGAWQTLRIRSRCGDWTVGAVVECEGIRGTAGTGGGNWTVGASVSL